MNEADSKCDAWCSTEHICLKICRQQALLCHCVQPILHRSTQHMQLIALFCMQVSASSQERLVLAKKTVIHT